MMPIHQQKAASSRRPW